MSKRARASESHTAADKRTRLAPQTIAFAYGGSLDRKVEEPLRLRGAFLSKREAYLTLYDLATNTPDPEIPPTDLRPPGPGQPIDEDALERLSETSSIVLRLHADVDLTEVVDGARAERVVPASVGDRVLAVVYTVSGAGDFHFHVDASFLVRGSGDEADLTAARQSATRHAMAKMGESVVSAFRQLALSAELESMSAELEQIEERAGGFDPPSTDSDRAWETVSVLPEGTRQAIRNLAAACKDPNTADESLLETMNALMCGTPLVITNVADTEFSDDDTDEVYCRADVVDVVIGRYPSAAASGAGKSGAAAPAAPK